MPLTAYAALDGTVRLDQLPAEPNTHMFLRPFGGGGLALKNPSSGVWEMYGVTYNNTVGGAFTINTASCSIEGVGSQAMQPSGSTAYYDMQGFGSLAISTLVSGGQTLVTNQFPIYGIAAGQRARYSKVFGGLAGVGGPHGEKLYFEATISSVASDPNQQPGIGFMRFVGPSPVANFGDAWNSAIAGAFVYTNSGALWMNGNFTGIYLGNMSKGSVLRVAIDATDAGYPYNMWFAVNNGPWNGDPNQRPGGSSTLTSSFASLPVSPAVVFSPYDTGNAQTAVSFNFGAASWAYGIPAGYSGWTSPVSNVYDVYAVGDGAGNISFDLSLTGRPVRDATTGFLVKSGDATRRSIGRAALLPISCLNPAAGTFEMQDGLDATEGLKRNAMVISTFNPQATVLGFRSPPVQTSAPLNSQWVQMATSEQYRLHFIQHDPTLVPGLRPQLGVQWSVSASSAGPSSVSGALASEAYPPAYANTADISASTTIPYYLVNGVPQTPPVSDNVEFPGMLLDPYPNQVHTLEYIQTCLYQANPQVLTTRSYIFARVWI